MSYSEIDFDKLEKAAKNKDIDALWKLRDLANKNNRSNSVLKSPV